MYMCLKSEEVLMICFRPRLVVTTRENRNSMKLNLSSVPIVPLLLDGVYSLQLLLISLEHAQSPGPTPQIVNVRALLVRSGPD